MYKITSSATKDTLVSSFPIYTSFISFNCLIALAKIWSTCLRRMNIISFSIIYLVLPSVSLNVIGLYKLLSSSWFNLACLYISKNWLISFWLYSLVLNCRLWLCYVQTLNYILITLWISSVSVAMSPFQSLILLVWIPTPSLWVNLDKGLSVLIIFSKIHLFNVLILCGFFSFLFH